MTQKNDILKQVPAEDKPLVNKVANSGLVTIKLEDFLPDVHYVEFDLKPFLFRELILKEKDFRAEMKNYDWAKLKGKTLLIFCSADAIIPKWAYMLITQYAFPFVDDIFFGTRGQYEEDKIRQNIQQHDWSMYQDRMMILKGCSGEDEIPASAYVEATQALLPFAKSIMYGEPCSTVPVYKRPKKTD